MGGIVVSPFLRALFGRMKSMDNDDLLLRVRTEVKHLFTSLKPLTGMMEVAEKWKPSSSSSDGDLRTERWLLQVESVLFDIDDMLDEVKMEAAASPSFFPLFKQHTRSAHSRRIKTVVRAVGDLARTFRGLGLASSSTSTFRPNYSPEPNKLVGRESDRSRIIDLILASVDKCWNVSVVPIVGFMGIGKTALAQSIYHDSRIGDTFDVKLWVRLGLGNEIVLPDIFFDIFKEIIVHTTEDPSPDRPPSLTEMKEELRRLIIKTRVFIVLDGCQEDYLRLSTELIDFIPGGAAFIVTTRSERVASLLGTVPAYQLGRLSLDGSYELFKTFTPCDVEPEILKLCWGIPLAVQLVGKLLSDKTDLEQWFKELNRLQQDGIIPYLTFDCYDQLPSYLKQLIWTFRLQISCRLTVDELTCLWMALGFLSSHHLDDPTQQQEYIGRKYLKEFTKSPLFSNVEYAPGGFIRDITVNDLAYDLATSKARTQVLVHGHSPQIDYSTARYFIYDTDHLPGETLPSSLPNANKARLFMLCHGRQASDQLVRDIVSSFKCLRVLGFGGCGIKMLPDSIGDLKHLRYLDLGRNASMKRLPDSICNLWNLQTLFLNGCDQLEQIPENIGRLQNLRYLTLTTLQKSLPEQIGQLSSLQTLGLAICPQLASLPPSVKNLKSLQTLGIVDCQEFELGVISIEGLRWMNGTLLLSGLPKLEHLPSVPGLASISLKHLMIHSCQRLTDIIWMYQLKSLCSLTIEECPRLSNLTDGASQFNNLVELVIRGCPSLASTTWIKQFISLQSLIIDDCPNLVALDGGFARLKYLERLEIRRCPDLIKRCASPAGEDWPLIAHVLVIELME